MIFSRTNQEYLKRRAYVVRGSPTRMKKKNFYPVASKNGNYLQDYGERGGL